MKIAAEPLVSALPHRACELIVAIPARDEEATIAATLHALAGQRDLAGRPLDWRRYEVIVLANNCRDNTVRIAREIARQYPGFALHVVDRELPEPSHVGHARRLVMDEAWRRLLEIDRPHGAIATTDADTIVSETWVAATRFEIWRGADSVGGRISIHPDDLRAQGAHSLRYHLKDVGYRSLVTELGSILDPVAHDPWPRHFQHFGASTALTARMYRRVGGLPVRPYLEDVALYDRLKGVDARIRHSPLVRVTTSGRMAGRTSFGFAVQLARWQEMERAGGTLLVESAAAIESRALARRLLRAIWQSCATDTNHQMIVDASERLGISPDVLLIELSSARSFGTLWQAVERHQGENSHWREAWPLVTIDEAIQQLRYRLDTLRRSPSRLSLFNQIEPVASFTPAGDRHQQRRFSEAFVDDVAR